MHKFCFSNNSRCVFGEVIAMVLLVICAVDNQDQEVDIQCENIMPNATLDHVSRIVSLQQPQRYQKLVLKFASNWGRWETRSRVQRS